MQKVTTGNDQIFLGLEKRYWKAMRENDVDTAVSLTKFPCLIAGPQGLRKVEEDEYRKMMESMNGKAYQNVTLEDPKVAMLNEQTALVAYSTHMNGMRMLDVSTWVKDGTDWICAFHSENPLQ